jgi:hypothetical protein
LGSGELVEEYLTDARAKNARSHFANLLRLSVYSRLPGYEDVNDTGRPCHDPTFRLIGSKKIWDRRAALTSWFETFEIEMLAEQENFVGLARLNRARLGRGENNGSNLRGGRGEGFHRDPGVPRARTKCQQRGLRVHLR